MRLDEEYGHEEGHLFRSLSLLDSIIGNIPVIVASRDFGGTTRLIAVQYPFHETLFNSMTYLNEKIKCGRTGRPNTAA